MSYQIRFFHVIAASFMAITLTALLATRASSTTAPESVVRIGVVDTEKILLNSNIGKTALADLKKLQELREGEAKSKQQEIKDLQTRLAEGRQSLSQNQIAQMQKDLEAKLAALRRFQDDATRDLNKKRDEILGSIDQKVMPVINQAGKELGYTAIFRKFESGLIYADDAIDITNLIIRRLDAGR